MGALHCVDGSVLSVEAVNCRDRAGQPYEITLNLARDAVPFAAVGQRCGYQLAQLAERVTAARDDPQLAAAWPDPDDRFPAPDLAGRDDSQALGREQLQPECGEPLAGGHPARYLPGDHEYFALHSRDRTDPPGSGELRCVLRSSAVWVGECAGTGAHAQPGQRVLPAQRTSSARHPSGGHGRWQLTRRAVIEAWGTSGIGVRAVLTSAELVAFLDTVLTEPESAYPNGADSTGPELAGSQAGANQSAGRPSAGRQLVGGKSAGSRPAGSWSSGSRSAGGGSAGNQSAGTQPGGARSPRRQRGRVPDGSARSGLPAIRAQARGGAVASGGTQARRGDVRRKSPVG